MKSSRRIFIKQSALATIATFGAGPLLWTNMGCAMAQDDIPGDVNEKGEDAGPSVQCDRADALYRIGEPVHFSLQPGKKEGSGEQAVWYWNLRRDSMTQVEKGEIKLDGKKEITGKLDEPGFLSLTAIHNTKTRETMKAVVGIDPLGIKPSLPAPLILMNSGKRS